jgi:protein-disulfide isomerase
MKRTALIAALLLAACHGQAPEPAPSPTPAAAKPTGPDWVATIEKTPEGGMRMGNPAAPVKLIEYGSRSCPTCKAFAQESGTLRSHYIAGGKVSYEFRDYVIHPQDVAGIMVGRCADPANYFALLDAMFTDQDHSYDLLARNIKPSDEKAVAGMTVPQRLEWFADKAGYLTLAARHGVPIEKARACFADKSALDTLGTQQQAADKQYKLPGTPSFILNGKLVDAASWAELEPLLKAAGG